MFVAALIFGAIALLVVVLVSVTVRNGRRMTAERSAKQEALFSSMFPDLQPYFHPKNVLEFVRARLAQEPSRGGIRIKNPPGFPVDAADVSFQTDSKGREHEVWHLLDGTGQRLSAFMFESDAKDGMVRVANGKFRVGRTEDRVRYWSPDREFKWSPPGLWRFVTPMAQEPFDSDRNGMSFSDSSSSSVSRTATTAAAVAGIAAAGGAFDGGGASASWDGKSRGDAASSDSSAAGATTY